MSLIYRGRVFESVNATLTANTSAKGTYRGVQVNLLKQHPTQSASATKQYRGVTY